MLYVSFLQGVLLMLLPLDMLVNIYMHLVSAILIFGANILSRAYVEEEIQIVHNNGIGGSLYRHHIPFMRDHLYEDDGLNGGNINNQDSDKLSFPFYIVSLLKLTPSIKRQVF